MEFEFDPTKSESNRAKHGIDFTTAGALWDDPLRVEFPARTMGEPRFLVVGTIDGVRWSAIFTYRGAAVRIISVRRARPEEVRLYEDQSD